MVPASDPVTIRLCANRRRHEPRSGSYVTRDERNTLVRRGAVVTLHEAGTGADITSSILPHRPTEH